MPSFALALRSNARFLLPRLVEMALALTLGAFEDGGRAMARWFTEEILLMLKRMWKHELCLKCLTIMAHAILAQALPWVL